MFNSKITFDEKFSYDIDLDPVVLVDILGIESTDLAEKICSRTVLTKNIIKVIIFLIKTDLFNRNYI
jgi:hypothetical protein